MSDLTDRLRQSSFTPSALCVEAADELDRLRVTVKMLMDDKTALLIQRDDYKSDSIKMQRERDALREALREYIDAADDCVTGEDGMAAMLRFGDADKAARAALKGVEP